MSSAGKALVVGLGLLGFLSGLLAADPQPTREQVLLWVEQLGDNDFSTRDKAAKALWQAGRVAEDALKKAAQSDDVEVRRRADAILDKFQWGIYPDTPRDIVDLIQRYRGGPPEDKQAAVQELFNRGSRGCAILVKIARAEEDLNLRQNLFRNISQEAARAVPKLLADGDLATLDELVDLSLTLRPDDKMRQNHAAYFLLRGKIDERLTAFKDQAEKSDNPDAWQALAFLYRARGDGKAARAAAEKGNRLDFVQMLLAETGDWRELSRFVQKQDNFGDAESLALQAAFHRLAGDSQAFDKTIVDLRKLAEEGADADVSWLPTKALLLNVGPGEVLESLAKTERAVVGFDLLFAQMKIEEALAYADKATVIGEGRVKLELHQARALVTLGEKEKGLKLFARYGDQLKENPSASWADELIKNEVRAGLKDQALAHAATALAGRGEGEQISLLAPLYPQKKDQAAALWQGLRQARPDAKPAELIGLLDEVLTAKMAGADLLLLLDEAARKAKGLAPAEVPGRLTSLGELALEAGLEEAGRRILEMAADSGSSPEPLIALGDHLARKKDWDGAISAYGRAHDKDPRQPLPSWLKGWALIQAGRGEDGRKLVERAHWQPLGDEMARTLFSKELAKRPGKEAREALEREVALALKTGLPGSYYSGEILRLAAGLAFERKDYLQAADYQEKALLRVMTPYTEFIENTPYVTVPHSIHAWRARGLIALGRMADAKRELDYSQKLMPGHVDLPIQVVPELEKQNEKKLADDVFSRAYSVNEKACRDYPESATHHNNLAWLCACCRRELDVGLEHAEKAVKLTPEDAGHLDTLAEIHFQRGNKARAIELMKKCVALDNKRPYYQKQLQRFEAGDPKAAIPNPAED